MKYDKGEGMQLSENFSLSEFECNCSQCSTVELDMNLIRLLEALRERLQAPIKVTSGYRCPAHNKAVGGVSNSQHVKGTAADIQVSGYLPVEVAAAAEDLFGGIGTYNNFTHLDVRQTRARWKG